MLSGDSKKNSQKTVGLISKKNHFACTAHFVVHFFAAVFHDDNVKPPKTS